MSPLKTNTTELGDSRLRVDVEVDPEAVEREIAAAASEIGKDMKVPGFRQGKVPAQVVVRQVGRPAVLQEAVSRTLGDWYEQAVREAGIVPVGDPNLDVTDLPEKGEPLAFAFEVGVRPPAKLGDWRGAEVERHDAEASDEEVEAELERMRESVASLETVDRAAEQGDFVVMDFVGTVDGEEFEGGDARGFLLELGSGRLIEGFEAQLEGATADEERTVEVTFPEDYQAEHLAGRDAKFAVTVKEVKAKQLPELDDDFALEAGGYDTVAELREEIAKRIAEAKGEQVERDFREAAVDAVAERAEVEIPHALVHAKAHEMWHQTTHRLRQQGLDPEQYLQFVGKTAEELVTESEPDAERALRREAALAAIVETEGIEVDDDELLDVLRQASTEPGKQPPSEKALRRSLKKARARGGDEALREDIAMRKAVDLIVEAVEPVSAAKPAE
ncbi:MAG: trigger factor [Solirubrobacterales bacterium]|nr:trigger factor [Solirubrobacterales bacterium]